jgi:starvation-inducible DNA-binding protein
MMNPTKNDLPVEIRSKLCQFMNERLADLIDLQLQTKQAHWNVKGPQFIALHLLFDEIAGELPEHVDTLAERVALPKERWPPSVREPSWPPIR